MTITTAQLRAFSPTASAKIVDGIVANQKLLADAGITTPLRIRHFMAQAANETGGLARLEENLSYSAKRLCQVWEKRFPTIASATPYAKNPEKLANKVYGGRLGNDKAGDGWRYRGSGILQTTGKDNFGVVQKETGVPVVSQPELLRTFPGALQAACIYWAKHNINKLADHDDIEAVTKAVNGGLIGLDDRKAWLTRAKKVWPNDKPVPLATIVPIEPKPAPTPAPVTDKELIRRVQLGLTALKYNPGGADGLIGPLTAGAIRIFRSDNGLPEGDFIDDELISALANAKPREMVAARANATGNQVAAVVPEANAHWWNKWIGGSAGGGLGAAALVDAIAPTKGYMEQIRDLFTDVPGYVFLGVGAVLLLVVAYLALHGQKASDEAYRAGDRR